MIYPDPDDPAQPARPGVRPFLKSGRQQLAVGYRPAPREPDPPVDEQTTALRPFVITAGRTDGADPAIGMETQVTVNPAASPIRLSPEMRAIISLCGGPVSVAEISARLRLHLGVTRILVGDLRAAGQLDVHVMNNETPDPDTILRVIRGLRAIT